MPAFAGTNGGEARPCLTYSHVKQPSVIARIAEKAPGTPSFFPPSKQEGAERRQAHQLPRPLAGNAAASLRRMPRLSALHRGVLPSGPGTALPCADGGHWPYL